MGGPPATLMSAICPSGMKDCARDAPSTGGPPPDGAGICGPPIEDGDPPLAIEGSPTPIDGASDMELAPLGRRGRLIPVPRADGKPPLMPSMFWARNIGVGAPTAPAKANAEFPGGTASAPWVPIGMAPPRFDPLPLPPPIGTNTRRRDSM